MSDHIASPEARAKRVCGNQVRDKKLRRKKTRGKNADKCLTAAQDSCNTVFAEFCFRRTLFAEAWFYRNPLAPLGAAAGKNLLAALGLHARAESVLLDSPAPVRLESTLGHEKVPLLTKVNGLKANKEYKRPQAMRAKPN
jgi:hypothetical protein